MARDGQDMGGQGRAAQEVIGVMRGGVGNSRKEDSRPAPNRGTLPPRNIISDKRGELLGANAADRASKHAMQT